MKFRISTVLTIAAMVLLCASIAGAQTKPDFSGAWKMNTQKTKFAGGGGPDAILVKIVHKEPALTEDASISMPVGDGGFQAKYTTDGKETEQYVMGRIVKTSAKWEGTSLIIEFKGEDGFFFKRVITLSADGKTMTEVGTRPVGEDTVVFEKQ